MRATSYDGEGNNHSVHEVDEGSGHRVPATEGRHLPCTQSRCWGHRSGCVRCRRLARTACRRAGSRRGPCSPGARGTRPLAGPSCTRSTGAAARQGRQPRFLAPGHTHLALRTHAEAGGFVVAKLHRKHFALVGDPAADAFVGPDV